MPDQPIPPYSGGRYEIGADGVRRRVEAPTAPAKKMPPAPIKTPAKAKPAGFAGQDIKSGAAGAAPAGKE